MRETESQSVDAQYELSVPPAASTIEALRGIGYSLTTAVADLIDNSISAGALTVWIDFWWAGAESQVTILDDGIGMSDAGLSRAMRLGSTNPLDERDTSDLGRFGLGLKTASFSQCRRLTVATRQVHEPLSVRSWDLDYVLLHDEWRVLRQATESGKRRIVSLDGLTSGTLVLWEHPDQLVGDATETDTEARVSFTRAADSLREHLGMVFHRYLGGKRPLLQIYLNGRDDEHRVEAWDPFLESHPATVTTPEEFIEVAGGTVAVKGFILPHRDKLTEPEHRRAAGPAGWNGQQGFYVYRNRRLLVAGSWLGLGAERPWAREEQYKLARLRLDLPNSMDSQWQIDVRKSVARPPTSVRVRLRQLAETVRVKARHVFSHRGQYQPRVTPEAVIRAWKQVQQGESIGYRVNRDHPLVADCLCRDDIPAASLEQVLRLVESTVPVQKIWLDMAEHPDAHALVGGVAEDAVRPVLRALYEALRVTQEFSHAAAKSQLLRTEPFNSFAHLVDELDQPERGTTE